MILSKILEIPTRGDATSGRLHPTIPCPSVEPMVLTWNDTASIVFAAGELKQHDMLKLAALVLSEARRPDVRVVYVVSGIFSGRLGALRSTAETLAEAREAAAVVAFLEGFAYGPSLWLAGQCHLVFASPCTSIGWLACYDQAGELDTEVTIGMVDALVTSNPDVPSATWPRLVESAVTAEQAEAIGIIPPGNLKRDVFALSGLDPNLWGQQ